jgi:predicted amidophosphoribosyltransferase
VKFATKVNKGAIFMNKWIYIVLAMAGLFPIISSWTCSSCGQDNPELREICWWCGKSK